LAFDLQGQEFERVYQAAAAAANTPNALVDREIQHNIALAQQINNREIRMGAPSFAATANKNYVGNSGGRRIKDKLVSVQKRVTQSVLLQQGPMVEVSLPPSLLATTPSTLSPISSSNVSTITTSSPVPPTASGGATSTQPPTTTTPGSNNNHTKSTPLSLSALDRKRAPKIWYDVSRPRDGDPVFLRLLGNYKDAHDKQHRLGLIFPPQLAKDYLATDRTVLSEAAISVQLEEETNNDTNTLHSMEKEQKMEDDLRSVSMSIEQVAVRVQDLTMSLRAASIHLPFAVQFQLERSILFDHDNVPLRVKKKPDLPSEQEKVKKSRCLRARKFLLVVLKAVVPPLLRMVPMLQQSLTLQELFADALGGHFKQVAKDIELGNHVNYFERSVQQALEVAQASLQGAERLLSIKELALTTDKQGNTYTEWIQKRSLWPVAEYRCKFTLDGRLLPTELELLNKDLYKELGGCCNFQQALKQAPAVTRRAMREIGWVVRDRFLVFSRVPLHDTFRKHMVTWLRGKPTLCHRPYEFLFDKGTGKPNVWLFSPCADKSRSDLLDQLGDFRGVDRSKLGDRISLAFTQTKPLIRLAMDQILPLTEVVTNGYRFSDGCGVMGKLVST
jgi:hypothetical protein